MYIFLNIEIYIITIFIHITLQYTYHNTLHSPVVLSTLHAGHYGPSLRSSGDGRFGTWGVGRYNT